MRQRTRTHAALVMNGMLPTAPMRTNDVRPLTAFCPIQEERLSDARRVGAAAAAHAVRSMAALEASAMRALQAADAKATAQLERLRTMQAKVEAAVNTGRSRRLNGRWSA